MQETIECKSGANIRDAPELYRTVTEAIQHDRFLKRVKKVLPDRWPWNESEPYLVKRPSNKSLILSKMYVQQFARTYCLSENYEHTQAFLVAELSRGNVC